VIDNHVQVGGDGMTTSSTLLAGVKAHEPEAWKRFVTLYQPLVFYWCRQGGLQAVDGEDVAQNVFNAVYGAIDRFRHDQDGHTLRGWLRTITRNKVRDHARRATREVPPVGGSEAHRELLALPESPHASDDEADATEEQILIRQAFEMILSGFKDYTRQAFWRVVVDGQKPEDVAEELGIKVDSVYLARSRVLCRLKKEFGAIVGRTLDSSPISDPGSENQS
jgi:RNA polymerase sigma-70 factor, ECF subfamily